MDNEVLSELMEFCHKAYERGFVGGTGGNLSVRVGDDMYITSSGCVLGNVTERDLARVPIDVGTGSGGKGGAVPSKEAPLHLSVYRARPDLRALIHLHPVHVIAAALMLDDVEKELPIYAPSILIKVGSLPQVGYYRAGSPELGRYTARKFRDANAVLMRRHGLITGGDNLAQAFARVEDIEEQCRLHLLLRGKQAMTKEEIADFRAAVAENRPACEMKIAGR